MAQGVKGVGIGSFDTCNDALCFLKKANIWVKINGLYLEAVLNLRDATMVVLEASDYNEQRKNELQKTQLSNAHRRFMAVLCWRSN